MKMYEELEQEEKNSLAKFFPTPPMHDYVRYPGPVIMPRTFIPIAERIRNFDVRPDDIWIVTYPKSGTTWTQEMVWQIVNDVNLEKGQLPLFTRTPFLEFGCVTNDMPFGCPPGMPQHVRYVIDSLQYQVHGYVDIFQVADLMEEFHNDPILYTSKLTGRRVIKCHLPMEMQPKEMLEKCKVIYVARNIKDMAVSWFHHLVNITPHDFQVVNFHAFNTSRFFRETLGNFLIYLKKSFTCMVLISTMFLVPGNSEVIQI